MKRNLLYMVLFLVIHRGWCEPPCLPGDNFFAAGTECFNFYLCRDGFLSLIDCQMGMLWNDVITRCDDPENVICSGAEPPATVAPTPAPSPTTEPTPSPTTEETPSPTGVPPSMTFMPETEGALPILFPDVDCPPDIRAFQVHATDCRRFFYCLYGIRYSQTCPFLQFFNFIVGHCVEEDEKFCFPNSE